MFCCTNLWQSYRNDFFSTSYLSKTNHCRVVYLIMHSSPLVFGIHFKFGIAVGRDSNTHNKNSTINKLFKWQKTSSSVPLTHVGLKLTEIQSPSVASTTNEEAHQEVAQSRRQLMTCNWTEGKR